MTMLTKMISMMIMEIKKIVMTKVGESLNDLQGRSTRQWYWLMMMGINYSAVGILIKLNFN